MIEMSSLPIVCHTLTPASTAVMEINLTLYTVLHEHIRYLKYNRFPLNNVIALNIGSQYKHFSSINIKIQKKKEKKIIYILKMTDLYEKLYTFISKLIY